MAEENLALAPLVWSQTTDDDELLRTRMQQSGYLAVRSLAPVDVIVQLRRDMAALVREAGWLAPAADAGETIWSGDKICTENEPEYMAVYKKIVYLSSFNALPQQPEYMQFMRRLLGGPAVNHNLRIGRVVFPHNTAQRTGAHQDFQYIEGSPQTVTAWTPLTDCPMTLGGLAILAGSQKLGRLPHTLDKTKKYAGSGVTADLWQDRPGLSWVAGDMQLGDVLMFTAFTVHQALPNLSPNRLRFSTDNRYQRLDDACLPRNFRLHYDQ